MDTKSARCIICGVWGKFTQFIYNYEGNRDYRGACDTCCPPREDED